MSCMLGVSCLSIPVPSDGPLSAGSCSAAAAACCASSSTADSASGPGLSSGTASVSSSARAGRCAEAAGGCARGDCAKLAERLWERAREKERVTAGGFSSAADSFSPASDSVSRVGGTMGMTLLTRGCLKDVCLQTTRSLLDPAFLPIAHSRTDVRDEGAWMACMKAHSMPAAAATFEVVITGATAQRPI